MIESDSVTKKFMIRRMRAKLVADGGTRRRRTYGQV